MRTINKELGNIFSLKFSKLKLSRPKPSAVNMNPLISRGKSVVDLLLFIYLIESRNKIIPNGIFTKNIQCQEK